MAAASPHAPSGGVFVSYAWGAEEPPGSGARPLQQRAHRIVAAIRARAPHLEVWLDVERMGSQAQGGGGLSTAMAKGIDASAVVVCCMSEAYSRSANCKSEFIYAINKHKPILYANVGEPGWVPYSLTGDEAWMLLRLEDKLWADCRTDAAFAGPGGVAQIISELPAAPAARSSSSPAATAVAAATAAQRAVDARAAVEVAEAQLKAAKAARDAAEEAGEDEKAARSESVV